MSVASDYLQWLDQQERLNVGLQTKLQHLIATHSRAGTYQILGEAADAVIVILRPIIDGRPEIHADEVRLIVTGNTVQIEPPR